MIKLGITGGIGSGKSIVSRLLRAMDIPVYQTDDESKRLVSVNEYIRENLIRLVGSDVYAQNGSLNKKVLANYIFGFPEHIHEVDAIIHPVVKQDFMQWMSQYSNCSFVAVECAILYESGFDALVDHVVLVSAPLELRIQRAMLRDKANETQIRARIMHQLDENILRERAQFLISNDDEHLLIPQVLDILYSLESSRN